MTASLDRIWPELAAWRRDRTGVLTIGICGAQGSGKSTLAAGLAARLANEDVAACTLSLDDLYLPRRQRPVGVHPLFATRGVPGTHDVALGIHVLEALKTGAPVALPRFDKASDAPLPREQWPVVMDCQVVIFEGWCVGAVPQPEADLIEPVNALERDEDPEGVWRRHVNAQLDGPYRDLFARIDRLILLAAPGFEVVQDWRSQQEQELARDIAAGRPGRAMTAPELTRFIQHYERLTRHILREMPDRADPTVRLDANRNVL